MFCYRCNHQAGSEEVCPKCGANLHYFQKARKISNAYYNDGLLKANVRNISGAIISLRQSLKFNKYNTDARNLLGLCYLEVGETVDALSEWVISKNYQPEGNRASEYLESIQNNKGRLEAINQTIKKYNQALLYCNQDSRDLAIIQLKKVIGLNPRLVKAHQLLALLYMQEGKLEAAKKTLRNAGKVDTDNTTTLRYIKEVNRRIKEEKPNKNKASDDLISYQSGNETIIMPKRFRETSLAGTLAALVIGIVVGCAVLGLLVVPNVRKNAKAEAKAQLVEANDTISQNTQMISTLNEQIEELQQQLETQTDTSETLENSVTAYDNLVRAYYYYYVKEDVVKAGKVLAKIDTALLSKTGAKLYKSVNTTVSDTFLETAFNQGYTAYISDDYETAITDLKAVCDQDESYQDGQAAYYLAQAYRKNGDDDNAATYYKYILENYAGTEMARTASQYVE